MNDSNESPRPAFARPSGYAMGVSRDRRHVIVRHFNNFATRGDGRKVYTHQFAAVAHEVRTDLLRDNIKAVQLECRREDALEFLAHNYGNSLPASSQITMLMGIPVVFDHRIPSGEMHMVAESHTHTIIRHLSDNNKSHEKPTP